MLKVRYIVSRVKKVTVLFRQRQKGVGYLK